MACPGFVDGCDCDDWSSVAVERAQTTEASEDLLRRNRVGVSHLAAGWANLAAGWAQIWVTATSPGLTALALEGDHDLAVADYQGHPHIDCGVCE